MTYQFGPCGIDEMENSWLGFYTAVRTIVWHVVYM